jgi:hypothetical protein
MKITGQQTKSHLTEVVVEHEKGVSLAALNQTPTNGM